MYLTCIEMIYYLLGYETTSNCLAYTSYLLALHPDKQDILYQEIEKFYHENPVSKVYYGFAEIMRQDGSNYFNLNSEFVNSCDHIL